MRTGGKNINVFVELVLVMVILLLLWHMVKLVSSVFRIFRHFFRNGGERDGPFGPGGKKNRYLHKREDRVFPKRKPKLVDFDVPDYWGGKFERALNNIHAIYTWIILAIYGNNSEHDPLGSLGKFDTTLDT